MTKRGYTIIKRFAAMAGGSVVGQLMMIGALPIVAKLYTPADIGMLGAFGALVMLILPVTCLRYDLAIPIPEDDQEAVALAVLSVVGATVIAAVYGLALLLVADRLGPDLASVVVSYGWLLPLTLWAAAIFSAVQFWAVRAGLYGNLAAAHVARGLLGAGTQIGLGLTGIGAIGLLLGQAVYMGLGSIALAMAFVCREFQSLRAINFAFAVQTGRRNWRFPVFSVPESLLDSGGMHLPMLVIIYTSGAEVGGYLFLAQRITSIPIGIIGGNLSRVYLGEARNRQADGTLFDFTMRMVRTLFLVGAGPFILVYFGAPLALERFLGSEWANSADILQLILPAAFIQFCVVPVSTIFHVRAQQLMSLLIQASGLVLQVGSILLCHWTGLADPVVGMAAGAFVYFSIYAAGVYRVTRM